MHLRITRGSFDPARYDESVALSQEVGDALARLPGFVAYRGGGDRALLPDYALLATGRVVPPGCGPPPRGSAPITRTAQGYLPR